jgi:2'-5' RNA ligase
MKSIRAFIKLEIDDFTKGVIDNFIHKIKENQAFTGVKWVKQDNMHITLAFLGEIPIDTVSEIDGLLKEVACTNYQFMIKFTGLGFFPNIKTPRVYWIGIQKQPLLDKLKNDIDTGLERLGLPYDKKPFSPHLTIGRIKTSPAKIKLDYINSLNFDVSYEVSKIGLVKSQLFREGPLYTDVTTRVLKKDE